MKISYACVFFSCRVLGIMVLRSITIRNTNRFLVFENTQDGSAECTLILRESGLEIYEANRSLQAAVHIAALLEK